MKKTFIFSLNDVKLNVYDNCGLYNQAVKKYRFLRLKPN